MEKTDTGNYDYEMCKECGGKCCTNVAGMYSPDDFKEITVESLIAEIKKQKIGIDWWDGDIERPEVFNQVYFLRPRHVKEKVVCGSWGGICIHWSPKSGCALTELERPYQCRMLAPSKDSCIPPKKASKETLVKEWRKHQTILSEIVNNLSN